MIFIEKQFLLLFVLVLQASRQTTTDQYLTSFTEYQTKLCQTSSTTSVQQAIDNLNNIVHLDTSSFGIDLSVASKITTDYWVVIKSFSPLIIVGAVFAILIVVLMIIQLIIGIVNLCFCNKKVQNDKHANCCMTLMIMFFFLYAVALILVVIYVSIVLNQVQTPFCAFSQVPYTLLSGYNLNDITFIGLVPLKNSISNLGDSLNNLSQVQTNITNMSNRNLQQLGQDTIDEVANITTGYQGVQTKDSNTSTSQGVSQLFQDMDSTFIGPITAEFNYIGNLSKGLGDSIDFLDQMTSSSTGVQDNINTANSTSSTLDNITQTFSSIFDMALKVVNMINSQKTIYLIVIIVVVCVVFFIYLGMICMVYKQNQQHKCFRGTFACKLLLLLIIILSLAISLITLFMYGFNVATNSFCNIAQQLQDTSDFSVYFGSDNGQITSLFNKCIGSSADGKIFGVINNSDFTGLEQLMENFTNFKQETSNVNNLNTTATTTQTPVTRTASVLTGAEIPFTSITNNLAALNSAVTCASITFGYIASTTGSTKSVNDTTVLNNSGCYNYNTAEALRANLALAWSSNHTAYNSFSTVLSTANTTYTTDVTAVQASISDFNSIYAVFSTTLTQLVSLAKGFTSATDCRIFQVFINNLKNSLCNGFNKNLYILMIFLYILSYLMFFLNCCICVMTKRRNKEEEEQTDHSH